MHLSWSPQSSPLVIQVPFACWNVKDIPEGENTSPDGRGPPGSHVERKETAVLSEVMDIKLLVQYLAQSRVTQHMVTVPATTVIIDGSDL